jgi:hypothetical protein
LVSTAAVPVGFGEVDDVPAAADRELVAAVDD